MSLDSFDRWNQIKKRIHGTQNRVGYKEREVFWVRIGQNIGNEEFGKGNEFQRPVLIVRRLTHQMFLGVPLTSVIKEGNYFHPVSFRTKKGISRSTAMILQLRAYDKRRLMGRMGMVNKEEFYQLTKKIAKLFIPSVERTGLPEGELQTNYSVKSSKNIDIIGKYFRSWALLQGYDEQSLQEVAVHKEQRFILDYDEARAAIAELKRVLIAKGEAMELFGRERGEEFQGHLLAIYQSFGGEELLPSVEQKAAHLLYYIIKGHPFTDGNKRIGAYLFVLFLHKNGILYKADGEAKINDNSLASLALLVAASAPEQKEIIIRLITNMLYEGEL